MWDSRIFRKKLLHQIISDRKAWIVSGIISLFLSVFMVSGYLLDKTGSVGNVRFVQILAGIFIFAVSLFLNLFLFFFVDGISFRFRSKVTVKAGEPDKNVSPGRKNVRNYSYVIYFFAILAGWLPSFLGLYPGLFTYDSVAQYKMVERGLITSHHPVIHTLLLGGLTNLSNNLFGDVNKGVLAYTVIQMLVMAACFAYMIKFEEKAGMHIITRILSVAWLCFFPPNVILVMSCTKDSMFSAFVVLFTVLNAEWITEGEKFQTGKKESVLWIIAAFFTILMRKNAIYAMIPFLLLFFIVMRKEWKRVLLMLAILCVLVVFYEGPFCAAVVKESEDEREKMSVPCQQIMRVYKTRGNDLSAEERDEIENMFKDTAFDYYNPKIADAVKSNLKIKKFRKDRKYYIKKYLEYGIRFPVEYLDSFLLNTMDSWYPFSEMVLDGRGREGYLSIESREPAASRPLIPAIWNYYRIYVDSPLVQTYPVSKLVFSPAFYLYFLMFTTGYLVWKKKVTAALPFVFIWLLWGSFLLGPVVLIRYYIYLYYLIPFEISVWKIYCD